MNRVSAGETTVVHDPAADEVRVERDGRTLLDGRVEVAVAGRTGGESLDGTRDETLDASLSVEPADDAVHLTLAVENRGDEPVRLDAFRPLADAATPFGPDDRCYRHGYASWSPSASRRLDEPFPAATGAARPQTVDLAAPEAARTSSYLTALSGGPGDLTLGFLDHERTVSRVDLRPGDEETTLDAVAPTDGVALAPGETWTGPTLRVDATRPAADALAALADAVGDRMDARVPDEAPTGWCSWYHYFTDVTADDVRENVAAIDDWGVPLDLVQLDDGYQVAFGDWRTLADGFEDMRGLRDEVVAAGHTPGLWLAPFYVEADSLVAQEHPDWLVTRDGDPVDAGARHGPMYALDVTHPGVESWLTETFATVTDDWGFEYLKLDFLYAAALPGDRHADVTRAEAYRHGLETIREAAGDAFVLGCGAPAFPSVGLVDAMRIGPDTAPYWRYEGSGSEPAHENAVRNVLGRQWLHRRLWLNDPDCQLVRATTDLTRPEQESFAALVALLGGTNVVSDAVAEIDDAGRRLVERTLPPVETGRVEGLLDREFPDRVVCERPADGAAAVAAFNWRDEPVTRSVDPAAVVGTDADDGESGGSAGDAVATVALGGSSGPPETADAADPELGADLHHGPVTREVPAHGVLLVHCAPARDRPHLVGADHLANAASQVTAVGWDDGTLSVTLDAPGPADLVVATPGDWRLAEPPDAAGATEPSDETTTVTAAPGETTVEFTDA
jgi:alpha-galactosidase